MCSSCRKWLVPLIAMALGALSPHTGFGQSAATQPAAQRILRVAADPNNMPFSNEKGEGFENRIAELIAREMGAKLEYQWRAQRRGFFRETLKNGNCDLVIGAPAGFDMALTTIPYYRSTYVFVSRKDRGIDIRSFDDPQLKRLKIGLHLMGGVNPPPAYALANRGIVDNLVGYSIYGDYREDSPPARLIEAVAQGDVDVAVAWGPLAGYFARRQLAVLSVVPVSPQSEAGGLRQTFAISMAVRRGNTALRDRLNAIIVKNQPQIDRILDDYGVPLVKAEEPATHPSAPNDQRE